MNYDILFAGAALAAFVVITGFVFVFSVQRLLHSGVWVPWYVKTIAYIWLTIGLPADVLFNWIWGTAIFREFPREFLFTSRVQRHFVGRGWRQKKAAQWAEFMNSVDPGHV